MPELLITMEPGVDPRACGVNWIGAIYDKAGDGRSPRMRGKLALPTVYVVVLRSIPAHAG